MKESVYKNKKKGFTLTESLISVVIFLLMFELITNFYITESSNLSKLEDKINVLNLYMLINKKIEDKKETKINNKPYLKYINDDEFVINDEIREDFKKFKLDYEQELITTEMFNDIKINVYQDNIKINNKTAKLYRLLIN